MTKRAQDAVTFVKAWSAPILLACVLGLLGMMWSDVKKFIDAGPRYTLSDHFIYAQRQSAIDAAQDQRDATQDQRITALEHGDR